MVTVILILLLVLLAGAGYIFQLRRNLLTEKQKNQVLTDIKDNLLTERWKLQSALNKLQAVQKKGKKKNEEIDKTPDNDLRDRANSLFLPDSTEERTGQH